MADLERRIEALEEQLRTGRIDLKQLPLTALKNKLTSELRPDGDTFLLPKSVGNDSLEDDAVNSRVLAADSVTPTELQDGIVLELAVTGTLRKAAFGIASLAWPGGTRFSNVFTQAHGLGGTPVVVLATPLVGTPQGDLISVWTGNGAVNITIQAAWQAFVPAAGNANFGWLAIR